MKKGQVTIFILIGLLVFLFIGFFLFFFKSTPAVTQEESPVAVSVRTYVESCLENQLYSVTNLVALQGGYYAQPPYPLQYTFDGETYFVYKPYLSYYLYNQEKSVPTIETIEDAVSEGMLAFVTPCLNFSAFPYAITSSQDAMKVTTTLTENDIEAKVTLPITITEEATTEQLDTFTLDIPTNLYHLYSVASIMTEQQYEDGNEVCLTCITKFAKEYDVGISSEEFSREESYEILYRIQNPSDEKTPDTIFTFVYSFPFAQTSPHLTLLSIPDQDATIGYLYSYTVLAYGVNVTYADDSELFTIDPKAGMFSFTPSKDDVGTTIVTITATDAYNATASQSFVLTVNNVVSSDLLVEPLPYFTATVAEPFFYQVNATSNYTVYFTDDSPLFVIHPTTGAINFTPSATDVGESNFTITATDTSGNYNILEGYMYVVG